MIRRLLVRLGSAATIVGLALGAFGCVGDAPDENALLIGSSWPESDRNALTQGFKAWLANVPGGTEKVGEIRWVSLDPHDDLARRFAAPSPPLSLRAAAPDVILGGPATSYRQLARMGRLVAGDHRASARWFVVRSWSIGWARSRTAKPAEKGADVSELPLRSPRPGVTFDDPRRDPLAFAWAKGQLESGNWAEGYARLVRAAGGARRIGRTPGSALAAVARGESDQTPAIGSDVGNLKDRVAFVTMPPGSWYDEGVGIIKGGPGEEAAALFLRFLAEGISLRSPSPNDEDRLDADSLLADLLGSTLVDAQDELRSAWAELETAGYPERALMWIAQAPPWPPASVAKLLERDETGALAAELAQQLAPDPVVQAWLIQSWLGAPRLIDGRFLSALAKASAGRLVHEPRFRAWLRAEWAAWARQRYRRIARQAGDSAS